ncbi:uncharacterized protein LOC121380454 [Gigantopelta aegis]|uniref:uncharacterized protein LOC121380454 n=1 Tax=Gigantopelta aegis TaxID=1735272 RepID=UPI001B88951E|nr:uncharacterized protein LOC121380454 [Gigantopelta aegis]
MSSLLWRVFLLSLKPLLVSAVCGYIVYMNVGEDNTKVVNNILKTESNLRVHCAVLCYRNSACVAFSYNLDEHQCMTHSGGPPALNYTAAPGWMVYSSNDRDVVVEHWVSRVLGFSSQYSFDTPNWAGFQVLGAPDIYPNYGDLEQAWTPIVINANQWIQVEIPESVYVMEVRVYETWNGGALKAISVRAPNSTWVQVWQTTQLVKVSESRIFSPTFNMTSFLSNTIRLDLDLTFFNVSVGIDAIKVVGKKNSG